MCEAKKIPARPEDPPLGRRASRLLGGPCLPSCITLLIRRLTSRQPSDQPANTASFPPASTWCGFALAAAATTYWLSSQATPPASAAAPRPCIVPDASICLFLGCCCFLTFASSRLKSHGPVAAT
ncbi:UNVERIFIED_CONTAM: hypothetical protein K2H54_004284, partial [Gekko kuhli]